MRWLYLIVTILVLSSFEFIAMSHYRGGPDILLILTVFLALNTPLEFALVGAWLSGLFSEVVGGQAGHNHIGVLVFLFTFFAWLLVRNRQKLFTEHWLTRTLIVAIVSLLCTLGEVATIYFETDQWIGWEAWSRVFQDVLYTTIFSIPLILLFGWVKRIFAGRRA